MSLDEINKIDAAGVDKASGLVVLTIADSWDWDDEDGHILALKSKLNAYINFVESGQVWELYPELKHGVVIVDMVFRCPLPPAAEEFIARVSAISEDLGVSLKTRIYQGH
jgi:hypothetical protein